MRGKTGTADFAWIAAGAGLLIGFALTALYFHGDRRHAAEAAQRTRELALVDQLRIDLATSSEAEKSAVLAISDEDSQHFADQARTARAAVARGRDELATLLGGAHSRLDVRERLTQLSESFTTLEKIDDEVLGLAVKNTNLKASRLAAGPAAAALEELDAALAHLETDAAGAPSAPDALQRVRWASDARIRALKVQALLPRHIAEESDAVMDSLEARMAEEDRALDADLAGLARLRATNGSPDLETASSAWARFAEIRGSILALSRENTNVRSLSLSLTRKRKALLVCQEALAALRQAIEAEPDANAPRPTPTLPR
ncbi:MAG: hypothetical protein U0610_29640 [bacterium]